MKRFQVVVNGNSYEVEVEELAAGVSASPVAANPTPVVAPVASTPVATPKPATKSAPAAVSAGASKISSPMPGKIVSINVELGQSVKKGDVICILEAMKMENEIFAAEDGTIASVNVSAGDAVETGDVVVTIN
ncbi:MAG TPA: biotin/lipoyl-binding protein [Epulopiscium sp.]|nr:biotin/lipoyl-binding protein [Candidatus Epulonipiscium sp.]